MPTWVIVGASKGIGYQFLQTLSADASNTVIGLVRTVDPTKEKVKADGLNVHIVHGDLDDSASLYAAAKEVANIANGVVDYLIVNGVYASFPTLTLRAGDIVGAEKEELFISETNHSMKTNVIGPVITINAFMPLLLKSQIKKVINITSAAADLDIHVKCGLSDQLPYSMSKAALNLITAKFAAQYYSEGVKFLSLAPGYVMTFATDINNLPPDLGAVIAGFTEKFRAIKPDMEGPITSEESVDLMLKVIDGLTLEKSGQFLSQFGNHTWL
ncbi:hypothetical protein BCR34DRAFT_11807 [Clohesyomyces aquaticus]|uniref:NAD(P)-binding protein n=1 Tax=Clohesyomyces aquaticus TaxID=1231657 RepID=A0A1Y1ZDW8_9PLEO|nr:hypothetical protein BCR34DRAFT_11807 [Clohesyomyces aquaticus]